MLLALFNCFVFSVYYQVACMLINGLSLCASVLIIQTSSRGSYKRPSARLRSFIFGFLARLLRFESHVPAVAISPTSKIYEKTTLDQTELIDLEISNGKDDKAMSKATADDGSISRLTNKTELKLMSYEREAERCKAEWLLVCRILDYGLFLFVSSGLFLSTAGFIIYVSVLKYTN